MSDPLVVIVTFPSAQILDVTGPLEVFSSASRFLPAVHYRTELVSSAGGLVLATCGMQFATTAIREIDGQVDTLMIAGGRDMDDASADQDLLREVRRLAAGARRVTSVCSGAFLLAAAGLLDGRRATTHWAECGLLQGSYPTVTVDPDAIYVHDGNIWTSAGVTAGIDLALALVADDHGRQAAAPSPANSWCTCGAPAGKPSSPRCSPPRQPTANRCGTCCPGCPTTSSTTSPFLLWPDRSTCLNGSSAGCSRPRSAPAPPTTSRPPALKEPAGCSRPPVARSTTSPGPAASAPRRR